jgi:hypothetical protein
VGRPKVDACAEKFAAVNPQVVVDPVAKMFTAGDGYGVGPLNSLRLKIHMCVSRAVLFTAVWQRCTCLCPGLCYLLQCGNVSLALSNLSAGMCALM